MWHEEWFANKTAEVLKSELTWDEFVSALPQTLPEPLTFSVIGGLARNGFTTHDVDLYGADAVSHRLCLGAMIRELFGKPCNVGDKIHDLYPMPVPVPLYVNGSLRDRATLKATVERGDVKSQAGWLKRIYDRLDVIEGLLNV